MKYKPSIRLAKKLATVFANTLPASFSSNEWDFYLFIPSRRKSLQKRGFNQTLLLANQIKRATTGQLLSLNERSLLRTTQKPRPQATLPSHKRSQNVKGSLFLAHDQDIQDARILLVDDVVTTGATCREAVRVLKHAGAKSIDIAALACSKAFYQPSPLSQPKKSTKFA